MPFKVIKESILRTNDDTAKKIRLTLKDKAVLMLNLISAPGAGKTTLLERTAPFLKAEGISFAVVTGDCFTSNDAKRMEAAGINAVQINTGNACHIDAQLVQKALDEIEMTNLDLIIIENVGNLVCPAEFDVGEDFKVALLSTAEGEDKPLKYPLVFKESALILINKLDLLPYTDFDLKECERNISSLNPQAPLIKMSCKNAQGIEAFIRWIKDKIKTKRRK